MGGKKEIEIKVRKENIKICEVTSEQFRTIVYNKKNKVKETRIKKIKEVIKLMNEEIYDFIRKNEVK